MSIADLHERLPGLAEIPMIGILRKIPLEGSVELVRASRNAGLTVVEVTLDSPSALEQISRLATEIPGVSVGAGSVTGPRQVRKAHEAGAEFIVSPVVSVPVARACRELDLPHFPGAATPTEIQSALEAGAVAVKVFPAEQLGGASFIRALMSPLGDPPLMPTGGVTLENARAYLEAGACCLGVGSSMFPRGLAGEAGDPLGSQVEQWVEAVRR